MFTEDDSGRRDERRTAALDLREVRAAVRSGRYEVTARVRRHMRRKGWVYADLERCIGGLMVADFHKSQRHLDRPEIWLDIYRPTVQGSRKYVKFVWEERIGGILVLSFCDDGEAH